MNSFAAENNGQLKCYCGSRESVTPESIGPDVFCHQRCNSDKGDFHCGGFHKFSDTLKLDYYSIYCLAFTNGTSGKNAFIKKRDPPDIQMGISPAILNVLSFAY